MIRHARLIVIALVVIIVVGCSGPADPAATTASLSPTPIATAIPESTPTPTTVPTATPLPTATPTATPEPTPTPTPVPTPTPSPPPTPTAIPVAPAITVKQAETTEKIVALTFTTGADAGFTAQILDFLKKQNIKASFGVNGIWAKQNPDLVKRIVNEGHQIINATYDDKSFTGFSTGEPPLTAQQRASELSQLRDLVLAQTGYDVKPYFRPPYGDIDGSVLQDIANAGYSVNVMWSLDTQGWNGLTADEIVTRTMNGVTPGGIILMHVGAKSEDAKALPRVVQQLRDAGYRFVTVKQMVGR